MANVYTTKEAIEDRIGADRLASLLKRGGSTPDTRALTSAIERAGRLINTKLRNKYGRAIPFAEITDSPPTPEAIQELAVEIAAWALYAYREPDGRDAQEHQTIATEMIEELRTGNADIPVQRAAAHEGRVIAVATYESPVLAGTDATDTSRLRGV